MEKRIELEKRARKANQITELNLDNCRSTNIVGLTEEYTALEILSLINVGLTTLKGFPKLPNLKKLELSDNRISNGLNYLSSNIPKLQYLNLSGNKIKDLEALKPLEEFKNLIVLDLFNNEATQIDNYREKIFKMLPSLKYLDGLDCNDVEAPSDGEDDYDLNGRDSYDDVSDSISSDSMTDDDEDGSGAEDNEEDIEDDGDGDYDEGDVSLSEVYNEDLEEDNSEWDEENAEGDEDDDDVDDDDDDDDEAGAGNNNAKANKTATSTKGKSSSSSSSSSTTANAASSNDKNAKGTTSAENSTGKENSGTTSAEDKEARGKKRKLDG